ncbi:hypothetical protein SORDD20_00612 [Streptococcus oralis]|nr:hypothetical protein SORDD20_00612 [Streptococcus oralis]
MLAGGDLNTTGKALITKAFLLSFLGYSESNIDEILFL